MIAHGKDLYFEASQMFKVAIGMHQSIHSLQKITWMNQGTCALRAALLSSKDIKPEMAHLIPSFNMVHTLSHMNTTNVCNEVLLKRCMHLSNTLLKSCCGVVQHKR